VQDQDKKSRPSDYVAATIVVATLIGVPTAGCLAFASAVLMHRMGGIMTGNQVVDGALILSLLTFLLPPIVSFFRGRNTPAEIVGLIVFAFVFIFAGISLFLQDAILNPPAFDTTNGKIKYYLVNFIAVLALSVVWYQGVWKTVGASVTAKLEGVGPSPGDPQR
jgi:hypothetical protein